MLNMRTATISAVALLSIVFIGPKQAFAWRDEGRRHHYEHRYNHHNHPHFGVHVSFLPDWYFTVRLGGSRYFYSDGVYYSRIGRDYVVVVPPLGAVVRTIPSYYQPMIINGVTYYNVDGIYYLYTSQGYQVVPQPVTVVAPASIPQTLSTAPTQVMAAPASSGTDESFTINIPTVKGGYQAVTLKRSGDGFIGPQGEFYADFPRISQLKEMYGK